MKNKNKLINQIYIPIFFFSFFWFFATSSHAQQFQLGINPPLIRAIVKPGKSFTQTYIVRNESNLNQTVIARIIPFDKATLDGNPLLNPAATAPWISQFLLANSDIALGEPFEIKASSQRQLVLHFQVPPETTFGDHYATLLISTYNQELPIDRQGSSVTASIASNLLITINNQVAPNTLVRVTNLIPENNLLFRSGNLYVLDNLTPTHFSAVIQNDGNFTTESIGSFKIFDSQDRLIFTDSILPQYVIARSTRKLLSSSDSDFIFQPSATTIGHHTVQLAIQNDSTNSLGEIEVFYLPVKSLSAIFILILFVTIITKILHRQKSKKS